ncbi:MAG: hypothetical protein GOMPHAMPRED_005223 [Gomphillus americanus]|uniref:Uncharacterized protein n=1 Tax=Gomphillus americanus TaxID=1940652 RepID=A0A8H3IPN6_9LECA|nr:MAG: hypothetical protein GOMPHAMPRED_005223 [Gomphillus americanus]
MSTITATIWVPRGYAAEFPEKYIVDNEELARISKLAKLKLEDAQEDLKSARRGENDEDDEDDENDRMDDDTDQDQSDEPEDKDNGGVKLPRTNTEADDDLREYDLDNYDDDEEENGNITRLPNLGNPGSLAYHDDNADDPYLNPSEDEDEEDERNELQILRDDNMVVAARVEDEVAHLEVYVYEDEADNLYVHHDIMLPAIPLCIEWLDVAVGKTGEGGAVDHSSKRNFIAVGTFEPDIEIWNLDTVDCMYPNAILGQGAEEGEEPKVKKKKKKSKKVNDQYHTDAVLSLAANKSHRTLLASASADKTVKLWDLSTTKCAKSYSHHTDKVCSIEWSPKDTTILLSGSYDKTAVVADMRAPDAKVPRWGVESDIESVRWNPHDANYFFITTENGMIHYYDVRNAPSSPTSSKPIWKLQAHDGAVSSFDVNPVIPGFLASGSTVREVKLWNVQDSKPSLMVSRNLDVGRVFSTRFAPDAEVAFRLAVAGSKGSLQIWDTSTNPAVRNILAHRIKDGNEKVKERLTGVMDDGDNSDDEKHENGKDEWESMEE